MNKTREPLSFLKSAVALLLIALCLWASHWQFQRGVDRHALNSKVQSHIDLQVQPISKLLSSLKEHEWQSVSAVGKFNSANQILLRNHYNNEGVYGFELLTAFTDDAGRSFWVDCGWVKAPPTATEKPDLPELPSDQVTIIGRLRLTTSLPQGTFFAISKNSTSSLIKAANAQAGHNGIDAPYYLDLLSGNVPSLTPKVPAQLPELSDGPHMAYAIQWLFFGGLIFYGRILIRREFRKIGK